MAGHGLFVTSRGVFVDAPGRARPDGPGEEFLETAGSQWFAGPQGRGRAYARNGSILSLARDGAVVSAVVAGSGGADYDTTIRGVTDRGPYRLTAACDCPYGSQNYDWCKHAIAVGYAVAALLDGDVTDETGSIVAGDTVDDDARREELTGFATRLLTPPGGAFDSEATFADAVRWLPFPDRLTSEPVEPT